MYLQTMSFENVGPIRQLNVDLPFMTDGLPKPLVLVGPNGSGKTTVLSFIVNALLTYKQQVYDETEVEVGKVFRLRSGLYRRTDANFYHVKLVFEQECIFEEWVLDRQRAHFEKEVKALPQDDGWKKIEETQTNDLRATPQALT